MEKLGHFNNTQEKYVDTVAKDSRVIAVASLARDIYICLFELYDYDTWLA